MEELLRRLQDLNEAVDQACDAVAFLLNPEADDKGGDGSGGARPGAGRPRGDGGKPKPSGDKPSEDKPKPDDKPKPEDKPKEERIDTEHDGHKLSKGVQEAYDSYREKIKGILGKTIAQRNQGNTQIKLTKEERQMLKESVKEFSSAKEQFMKENNLSPKQVATMKAITKDWVKDSDGPKAMVMRQVMSELTGGKFANEFRYGEKISQNDIDLMARHRANLEKKLGGPEKLVQAVKAEMAFNQAMYKLDHGDGGMTVFRGVRTDPPPKVESGGPGEIKSGAAGSWSTSKTIANNFATRDKPKQPLLYSKQVKPEEVVFYYKANPAMMSTSLGLGEGEVVVQSKGNKIGGVNVANLKKSATSIPVIENYETDFEQFLRENLQQVVDFNQESDSEIEEIFK
jgi:hypothetical protein